MALCKSCGRLPTIPDIVYSVGSDAVQHPHRLTGTVAYSQSASSTDFTANSTHQCRVVPTAKVPIVTHGTHEYDTPLHSYTIPNGNHSAL